MVIIMPWIVNEGKLNNNTYLFDSFLYDAEYSMAYYILQGTKKRALIDSSGPIEAVRFAKKDNTIPNVELKWVKHKFDNLALENTIDVKLSKGNLKISHLELQIAFKEEVLKSPKDLDDAEHIKDVAKEYLDNKLVEKYREMLRGFY